MAIEYRWAEMHDDRLPWRLVESSSRARCRSLSPDHAVRLSRPRGRPHVPIVFATASDPISAGFVTSLDGRAATSPALIFRHELAAKRWGCSSELVPGCGRWRYSLIHGSRCRVAKCRVQAARARLGLADYRRRQHVNAIDAAFATLAPKRVDALLVGAIRCSLPTRSHVALAAVTRAGNL